MTDNETKYLPYETAVNLVGAIQEEEHVQEANRRIFTVYDRNDREICWFDAAETIAVATPGEINPKKEKTQEKVQEYILHHIPDWGA